MLLLVSAALAASVEIRPGDDVAALTSALGPGDVITFQDGVYTLPDGLVWTGLGTEDAPVVLKAADGAHPILELPLAEGGWYLLRIEGSTFLRVEGLTLRGGAGWETAGFGGIRVTDSTDITLTNLEVAQTPGTLVRVEGASARVSVTDSHLHDTLDGSAFAAGCGDASCWLQDGVFAHNWVHDIHGQWRSAIRLEPGAQGNVVRDNVVYRVEYVGLSFDSAEGGTPNVVEGNALWEIGDTGISARGAAVVRNNVVFNVGRYGLVSSENDRGTLQDLVIHSNTLTQTGEWAVQLEDWPSKTGLVFANNALCNPTGYGLNVRDQPDTGALAAPGSFGGNVVCGLVEGLDPASGAFLPGGGLYDFTDAAVWDFYPTPRSTLVDAGLADTSLGLPATDFNGAPREGDAPDAGAYERSGDANPGWAIQEGFKDLTFEESDSSKEVDGCGCSAGSGPMSALAFLLAAAGSMGRRRSRA